MIRNFLCRLIKDSALINWQKSNFLRRETSLEWYLIRKLCYQRTEKFICGIIFVWFLVKRRKFLQDEKRWKRLMVSDTILYHTSRYRAAFLREYFWLILSITSESLPLVSGKVFLRFIFLFKRLSRFKSEFLKIYRRKTDKNFRVSWLLIATKSKTIFSLTLHHLTISPPM